jgi:hypothetical protein
VLDSELSDIVRAIASTLFAGDVRTLPARDVHFDAAALCAQIELSGAFTGVLSWTLSEQLACMLAGFMLDQSPTLTSVEDRCDAAGELVNIAAGNLKGVLPSPCQLSLPRVQVRDASAADGIAPIGSASFELFGEPLCVELFGAHECGGAG